MTNTPDTTDPSDLMREAAHRLRFAAEMLRHAEDSPGDADDYGGYQFAMIRDVLEDVAGALKGAAQAQETK